MSCRLCSDRHVAASTSTSGKQRDLEFEKLDWQKQLSETDIIAIPTHEALRMSNASPTTPACLFIVDDAPLQRRLGICEVFNPSAS